MSPAYTIRSSCFKKTFAISLVALSLLVGLAPYPVLAQGADPLSLYVKAGIDASQHAQIMDMASQMEQANIGRANEILDLIKTIRALTLQPDLDEKKILATQNKINELHNAMEIERLKLNMKVRKILTPEQRMKLVSILKEERSSQTNSKQSQ